jgi:uncharacterized protein (TIGR03435 family)
MTFRIVANIANRAFARGHLRASALGMVALAWPLLSGPVSASPNSSQEQAGPASAPALEVASVKPAKPGTRGYTIQALPGRVHTANITLKMLTGAAYDVYDFQISGGPKWVDDDRYDVEVKAQSDTQPTKAQLKVMLQKVLEDRFNLEFHREMKTLPVYALELAKGGPKFQQSKETGGDPYFRLFQRRQITAQRAPLSLLTETLSQLMGRPVLDKTGLQGIFDFKLEWTPDATQVRSSDQPVSDDDNIPSLSGAVQEQLGLKLLSQKGPVEILVIDRAAKTSEN